LPGHPHVFDELLQIIKEIVRKLLAALRDSGGVAMRRNVEYIGESGTNL
jgi:transcription initiation factor IIE alpha subunit